MFKTFANGIDALNEQMTMLEKLNKLERNTGNLLFISAIPEHIKVDNVSAHEASDDNDTLVFSYGNFISPNTKFQWQNELAASSKIKKVVIVGAGIQTNHNYEVIQLDNSVKRFLEIASTKSNYIGVRGEHTANFLNDLGIKNVKIIGCPSMYNKDILERETSDYSQERKIGAISATLTGYYRDKIADLLLFGMKTNSWFIEQSEYSIAQLLESNHLNDFAKFITYYYSHSEILSTSLEKMLRDKTKMFFNITEWVNFLKTVKFHVGSRFHNTVACLRAGCPTLTLVFDSRTDELTKFYNLPCMEFSEYKENISLAKLINKSRMKISYSNIKLRAGEYLQFLYDNELKVKDDFATLVKSVKNKDSKIIPVKKAVELRCYNKSKTIEALPNISNCFEIWD